MAMIHETNQYMEIHDQELVIVKADSVKCKTMMAIVDIISYAKTVVWYR